MNTPKHFYFVVMTTIDGVELIDRSDRDVVEVVRCGECKHRTCITPLPPINLATGKPAYPDIYFGCDLDDTAIHDRYFFCRDGVRMDAARKECADHV